MKSLLKRALDPGATDTGKDWGLLLIRLGAGGMMLFAHGWGKLASFGERHATWADPIGLGPTLSLSLAVFAEFFCALAVILGLGTRLASVPLLITMLVAALVVHADDPWNKQEFPLLYATMFVGLIFAGSGRFSLDHALSKKL